MQWRLRHCLFGCVFVCFRFARWDVGVGPAVCALVLCSRQLDVDVTEATLVSLPVIGDDGGSGVDVHGLACFLSDDRLFRHMGFIYGSEWGGNLIRLLME